MKLEELITLINAGFTKQEITDLLKAEHPEPEKEMQEAVNPKTEPQTEPKPEQKPEPQTEPKPELNEIAALKQELVSLRNELHVSNIAKTEQPARRTIDDILADAMKGERF